MQTIKKYDSIIIFIAIFFIILPITLNVTLETSDELWNFQNIYKMCQGYEIYNDINVIITPLFFWIGELLLKILGVNIFVFRIYNAIILSTLFTFTYLLLKELKMRKGIALLTTLCFMTYNVKIIVIVQANYNIMALTIYVFGIYYLIKNKNIEKKHCLIQGLIAFIIFMTKQNMGIFYLMGIGLYEVIREGKIKEKIKNIVLIFGTFFVLIIIFTVILYKMGILYNFINYAFLGIEEFGQTNISFSWLSLMVIITIEILNTSLLILFIKHPKAKKIIAMEEKKNLKKLFALSTMLLLVIIPIMNKAHLFMAIYLSTILLIYVIERLIMKDIEIKKRIIIILTAITIVYLIFVTIFSAYSWIHIVNNQDYPYKYEDAFYGGEVPKETIENIESVIAYIKSRDEDVLVLSPKAALYMITLNRNNGVYDLAFRGNFGNLEEKGIIEELKGKSNTIILMEENVVIWQESDKIREFVNENINKIGTIEEFTIYKIE